MKDYSEQFGRLRKASEAKWEHSTICPTVYGFQIQAGTRWLPGLSEPDIARFESDLGFLFPDVLRAFLKEMNGTDVPAVNVYGETGHPYAYAPAYYSYPRDLERVRSQIAWIYDAFSVTAELLARYAIPHIFPVIGHRFLVVDSFESNPVLSMYGTDVIVYASSLLQFLTHEIDNGESPFETAAPAFAVPFWLEGAAFTEPPN